MMHCIRQGTRLFSGFVFFVVFICTLLVTGIPDFRCFVNSFIYAAISAILFWFAGFVIIDILVKGVISHIDTSDIASLLDGGIVQRTHELSRELEPGGAEMPFEDISTENNGAKKPTKKAHVKKDTGKTFAQK